MAGCIHYRIWRIIRSLKEQKTGIMIVMKENQDRNIQNVYRQIVEISKNIR